MKKALLRVLLVICGLNVFTACYGVPPGDWDEPLPLPEEQEQNQTKASMQPAEDPIPEESAETDDADSALSSEMN